MLYLQHAASNGLMSRLFLVNRFSKCVPSKTNIRGYAIWKETHLSHDLTNLYQA